MNDVETSIPSDHVFERIVRDNALVLARHMGFAPPTCSWLSAKIVIL